MPLSCNSELDAVIEHLAVTAALSRRVKQAGIGDSLQSFASNVASPSAATVKATGSSLSPETWTAIRNGLIGSGVGAVGGGLMGMKRKRGLKDAWMGALLGGAVGAGGTLGAQRLYGSSAADPGPLGTGESEIPAKRQELLLDKRIAQGEPGAPRVPEIQKQLTEFDKKYKLTDVVPEAPTDVAPIGDRIDAASAGIQKAPMNPGSYYDAWHNVIHNTPMAGGGAAAGAAAGKGLGMAVNSVGLPYRLRNTGITELGAHLGPEMAKRIHDPAIKQWGRLPFTKPLNAVKELPLGRAYATKPKALWGTQRLLPALGAAVGGYLGGQSGTHTVYPNQQ